ncbi:MAG: 30S ribosomal protein S20 [bacterium]|nr:30S ribosomal protein S20 [bacterium]
MPLIKGAIKKLRQDQARTEKNRASRAGLRTTLKRTEANLTSEALSEAFSVLDKAVKRGLIKKGKADRVKSRLSKKVKPTATKAKTVKPSSKKSPSKTK